LSALLRTGAGRLRGGRRLRRLRLLSQRGCGRASGNGDAEERESDE